MKRSIIAALAVAALATTGSAFAEKVPDCGDAPEADWMSQSDFEAHAKEMGYEVKNVKVEDGCYELYGMKDGERVEAFFDPVTGEMVGS